MKKLLKNIKSGYVSGCQKLSSAFLSPSKTQAQIGLFLFGVALLSAGLMQGAVAQGPGEYNDERVGEVINRIFTYLEGSFGALVMVVAGIGAIFSAAMGQYKAAIGLLIVAVGAFILRSLVTTFFNDASIGEEF